MESRTLRASMAQLDGTSAGAGTAAHPHPHPNSPRMPRGGGEVPFGWLFKRKAILAAWAVLVLGLLLPSRGFPVETCLLYRTTKCPCPACGMTRSVSSFLHGDWMLSWKYHPLGGVFAAGCALMASAALWPRRWRAGLQEHMRRHQRFTIVFVGGFLTVWVVYGLARLALAAGGWYHFPLG